MAEEMMARVGQALVYMVRSAEDAQERAARQQGLHPTDFRAIGYLHSLDGPASPKDINAYLGLTSGSGTALIDRLEAGKYIRRLPNPHDRRGTLIELDRVAAAKPIEVYEGTQSAYYEAALHYSVPQLEAIATYLEHVTRLSAQLSDNLYGAAPEKSDETQK